MAGGRPAMEDVGGGDEARRWRSGVVAPNPVDAGAPPGFHEYSGRVGETGGRPEWSGDVVQRRREGAQRGEVTGEQTSTSECYRKIQGAKGMLTEEGIDRRNTHRRWGRRSGLAAEKGRSPN